MRIIYVLLTASIFITIYNLLLFINKVPKERQSKSQIKNKKVKESNKQAVWLSKYIILNYYLKEDLKRKIDTLNLKTTPEIYIASNIIDNLKYFITAILVLFFINYLIGFLIFLFAVWHLLNDLNKINKELNNKRLHIESEIPRFLSYIIQSFQTSKNIVTALEIYEETASQYFRKDIQITLADIQSGSTEIALKRLDKRINSEEFSKIINAIISTCIRGEENIDYLKNLEKTYVAKKTENMRKLSHAKPRRIRKYGWFILIAVIIMMLIVIGTQIMSYQEMFW